MPSQFFGLTIASSGLRAANASLNTTANNIANAQTVGYSRQQATQQANDALRTFTTYGCAGAGVDTIAIERVRDHFYDVKYWDNNCKYGEYEVKAYYCKLLEDYFKDEGKLTSGFTTIFNKMSNALQGVIDNASSDSSKAEFISAAKTLTDYFNNMYGNLQEMQKDINLEIQQNVDEINSIAQKIATLNKQINTIELSGTKANDLRDQREKLVDELSEIVDVTVTEYEVGDDNNPNRKTGVTRYIVQIAAGQLLVDGSDYNTLTYKARSKEEKVNQSDADGLYDIMWANGNEFSLSNAAMQGKLKGLAQFRDGNNGSNFEGDVIGVPVEGGVTKVVVRVTEDYLKDMKTCTLSDTGGQINIANTIFSYSSWEYDAAAETYTFTMRDDPVTGVPDTSYVGKGASTSDKNDYQGIPYYMNQMNTWIRGFAEKVNEIFTSGADSYGNFGCIFFTGDIATGGQYTEADLDASKDNGYYELTAGNFAINDALIKDPGLLGTRTPVSVDPITGEITELPGVEECGQIKEMIDLLTSKEKYEFRNGSANKMLEMILSDAALNASNANTLRDTFRGLQNSIDNQRTSISGVDEDEEAVNLVKFQNAYTLSSKMIQTLTEIYDRLILQTGV